VSAAERVEEILAATGSGDDDVLARFGDPLDHDGVSDLE
jgi:hypothetical protein